MFQPIEILRLSVIISKRIIGSQFAERGGNNVSTADYFIYLLSCFLNDEKPRGSEQTDWQEIFRLAENHSVTAIIASLIKELPHGSRPKGKLLSAFEQSLDRTLKNYGEKMKAMTHLIEVLTASRIPHMLIKGAVLRFLYPAPELRASRDTDVVISPSDYEETMRTLESSGFKKEFLKQSFAQVRCGGEVFDIHTELESINVQSKIYYSTPFDDISENTGYTYKLKPIYHLLYVITHTACHLKNGGAGVRMIMDIDAVLRYYPDMDTQRFLSLCENIKVRSTAEALIALSKKWFKTPVAIDYTFEDEDETAFYNKLSDTIISSAVFASENGITQAADAESSTKKNGKADRRASWKALFSRLGKNIGKNSAKSSAKQEMPAKYFEVLNELQIEDSHHYE